MGVRDLLRHHVLNSSTEFFIAEIGTTARRHYAEPFGDDCDLCFKTLFGAFGPGLFIAKLGRIGNASDMAGCTNAICNTFDPIGELCCHQG